MTASTEPGQKPQKVQAERDFNFGVKQKVEEEVKTPGQEIMRPVTAEVQTKLLSVSSICIGFNDYECIVLISV